jgi:hypothetical protein
MLVPTSMNVGTDVECYRRLLSLPGPSCPDRFAVRIDDFINQHHLLGHDGTGKDNVGIIGNVGNIGKGGQWEVLLSGPILG